MTQERNFNVGKIIVGGLDRVVDFITLLLILLILLFGFYSLWDSHSVYAAADAANFKVYKPSVDNSMSFEELQKRNPDVFAWLNVYNTHIDYPVVHYSDDVKYLNTDALGNYNLAGAVFLDCDNNIHFTDFNSIIYGHHMDQKEMFGELTDFDEESFFDSHRYGSLWYDGEEHGLELFAYIPADAYDETLYTVAVEEPEKQQKYLDNIYSKAKYSRVADVTVNDRIVLLSTCSSYETNGRAILAGKITEHAAGGSTDRKTER